VLQGGLRLVHLGLYWRPLPAQCRGRQPTPLAHTLQRFKFGGDRYAGHCLALLFAESLADYVTQNDRGSGSRYDTIVPVPLSNAGLGARRFNQSAWLARRLSWRARVAYRPGWLQRPLDRHPQRGLGAGARRANVNGAFRPGRLPPRPGRVLLVDDVCTTGSTLTEAVRVLADAGAESVEAAVLILAQSG